MWGSDGRLLNLGRDERECANCGRIQPFQLSLGYRFFHVYRIFRLVTKKKYWLSCVVCEQGWELTPDKVESVIGKPSIPFWDRYSLVVGAVLAVALVYVLVPTPAERDQTCAIVGEGEVSVFQVRLGDCFNDDVPLAAPSEQASETEIAGIAAVPCTAPHDNEVYAVFDLDLARFPGQEQIAVLAGEACLERFSAFVGQEYEASVLDILTMYPTGESFARRRDREVVCSVHHMEGRKLVGSMRRSGR